MPIILINGEPVLETTQDTQTSTECPPSGLQDDFVDGPGGEEIYGDYNLAGTKFLSPINQINVSSFEQDVSAGSIREINLFDEFCFYRGENLFIANEQGDAELAPTEFSSMLYRSLLFKRLGFNSNNIFRASAFSDLKINEDQTDDFRLLINRFWCLEGTESQPIQEVWVEDRNKDIGLNRYNISIEASGDSKEKLTIEYTDRDPDIILPEAYFQRDIGRVVRQGFMFRDRNTSIPQPLLLSEALTLSDPSMAKDAYILDFNVTVNNRIVDPAISSKPEYDLSSLYREHYRTVFTDFTDDCNIQKDKVQKFISSNASMMSEANSSEGLLSNFNCYVEIDIKRPANEVNSSAEKLFRSFSETDYDKYFLELVTGMEGRQHQISRIMITDEKSPNLPISQQLGRTNDQFFVGFLDYHLESIKDLIDKSQDEEKSESRPTRVFNNSREYPLKFKNFDQLEDLKISDRQDSATFAEKFDEIDSDLTRNFSHIMNGDKANSIIIGYKIEKRRATDGRVIQVFYVMEPPGSESNPENPPSLKFIDTQVHYGSTYRYRIFSLALVFSSKYKYDNIEIKPSDAKVEFDVRTFKDGRLFTVPFYQKLVSIADLPPLPPEVAFLPDKNDPSNLKIAFNHNVGFRRENPISILPVDQSIITSMQDSQNNPAQGLEYLSDTVPTHYEMFMTTEPPAGYYSFSDLVTSIPTDGNLTVFKEMSTIVPNTDYYFTFRSREEAGISNPTPIYKFRMVDSPNGSFMVLEEYDPYNTGGQLGSFSFQRVLSISPSRTQRAIVYPEGTDLSSREFALSAPELNTISIGSEEDSVWGRRFKFRITSKKSGRKLDINATFEQNSFANAPTLQLMPPECLPVEQRRIEIPDSADNCLDLGPLRMPTIKGSITVRKRITCDLNGARKSKTVRREFEIDLHNIDGNGQNIFDYAKENNIFIDYVEFPDIQVLRQAVAFNHDTQENEDVDVFELVFNESATRLFFRDSCVCEENPDKYLNPFTEVMLQQKERATRGEDYWPIFDTEGDIPPHIQNITMAGISISDDVKKQQIQKEQEFWWTDTAPGAFRHPTMQNNSPATRSNEIQSLYEEVEFLTGPRLRVDTSDGVRSGPNDEVNFPLSKMARNVDSVRDNYPIYDDRESKAQPCLAAVKEAVIKLTESLFASGRTQDVLEIENIDSLINDTTKPLALRDAATRAKSDLLQELENNPLEDDCPESMDELADPILKVKVVFSPNDSTIQASSDLQQPTIDSHPGFLLREGTTVKMIPFVNLAPNIGDFPDNAQVKVTISSTAITSGDISVDKNFVILNKDNNKKFDDPDIFFNVTAVNDGAAEGNEKVLITFTTSEHPSAGSENTASPNFNQIEASMVPEIIDSGAPGFTVEPIGDQSITEGQSVTYTVTLNTQPAAGKMVVIQSIPPARGSDNIARMSRTTPPGQDGVQDVNIKFTDADVAGTQKTITFTAKENDIINDGHSETTTFQILKTGTNQDPAYTAIADASENKKERTITIVDNSDCPDTFVKVELENGSSECQCPEGTVEQDGTCVTFADLDCPELTADSLVLERSEVQVGEVTVTTIPAANGAPAKCRYFIPLSLEYTINCNLDPREFRGLAKLREPEDNNFSDTYFIDFDKDSELTSEAIEQAIKDHIFFGSMILEQAVEKVTAADAHFFDRTQDDLNGRARLLVFKQIVDQRQTFVDYSEAHSAERWRFDNCDDCDFTDDEHKVKLIRLVRGSKEECICPPDTERANQSPEQVFSEDGTTRELYCNGIPDLQSGFFSRGEDTSLPVKFQFTISAWAKVDFEVAHWGQNPNNPNRLRFVDDGFPDLGELLPFTLISDVEFNYTQTSWFNTVVANAPNLPRNDTEVEKIGNLFETAKSHHHGNGALYKLTKDMESFIGAPDQNNANNNRDNKIHCVDGEANRSDVRYSNIFMPNLKFDSPGVGTGVLSLTCIPHFLADGRGPVPENSFWSQEPLYNIDDPIRNRAFANFGVRNLVPAIDTHSQCDDGEDSFARYDHLDDGFKPGFPEFLGGSAISGDTRFISTIRAYGLLVTVGSKKKHFGAIHKRSNNYHDSNIFLKVNGEWSSQFVVSRQQFCPVGIGNFISDPNSNEPHPCPDGTVK